MEDFLQHRANINTTFCQGKLVVVYEDHRYILNILNFFKLKKNWSVPINVISLDFHDDCYRNNSILEVAQIAKVKGFTFEHFYNYIEFEHSPFDDDWVISGIEYGLIDNFINLMGKDINKINKLKGEYIDYLGAKHIIFSIPHEALERSDKYSSWFDQIINIPFILDFDLDFMTKSENGKNVPYNEDELRELFKRKFIYDNTLKEIIKMLIENAALITICKESKFCGGFSESSRLLTFLNENFFKNSLDDLN